MKGLIHEVVNISCNNGSFISVFGDEDPGILQVASRLFQIPEEALTSTFNISKLNVKYLKSRIQQNPSTERWLSYVIKTNNKSTYYNNIHSYLQFNTHAGQNKTYSIIENIEILIKIKK